MSGSRLFSRRSWQKVVPVITDTALPRNCVRNFLIMSARPPGLGFLSRAVTLSAVPESVAASRRWSRETMADWELDEITDTGAQLVSELVTNSVEHAKTARVRLIV